MQEPHASARGTTWPVGYSLGSAIGGLVLATGTGTGTGTGHPSPNDGAFTTAALVGIAAMAITAVTSLALPRCSPETDPIEEPTGGTGRTTTP
ncbi:hypothetical protein [Streptomyces sp. S584]|uniref:hypothetical protein n=1 Tax=Streptomyces sp. S584 TaxID=3096010 RepID=UPI002AFDDB76|nr:hypothetical protein [Streptomyces sp. S584]